MNWLFTSGGQSIGASASVFPISGGSLVKNLLANARDMDSVPKSGRSPGGGNGNPPQYFQYPGKSHGQRAWQAIVHGVARVGHDLATKPTPPHTTDAAAEAPILWPPDAKN